jgi:hypothetical protein
MAAMRHFTPRRRPYRARTTKHNVRRPEVDRYPYVSLRDARFCAWVRESLLPHPRWVLL